MPKRAGRKLEWMVAAALGADRRRGMLVAAGLGIPCAFGRAGVKRRKREGDGATPSGRFRLVAVFYRPDRVRRPATALPVQPIRPNSGWCDDPADHRYNRPVRLPHPASHERLWRDDQLYDYVVVLDHNLATPKPGFGSAIFLHVAAPSFTPTAGCVAITPEAMRRLLARVGPRTILVVR
jgi:L,D-peptidoglycan transpeptidase YkuD (ErfK/YbiS/YcfS/YnhG family)